MRCPGQDRRYWKEDAVFDVPCPKCGSAVELFKDESSGRCPRCGHRLKNPKIAFGCAEWCAYAEQCVGFVPQSQLASAPREGAISGRLIRAVKEQFEADQGRLNHALMTFQHAKELVGKEGGDPRVVLAAALLLEVGGPDSPETASPGGDQGGQGPALPRAQEVLRSAGLDAETCRRVCEIIHAYRTEHDLDTIEFKIVRDSDRLAKVAAKDHGKDRDEPEDLLTRDLKTESARARARSLFRG